MKNKIRIDYSIGAIDEKPEIVGTYYFKYPDEDPKMLVQILKKCINRLKINEQYIVSGIFDVFKDNKRKYIASFIKVGDLFKLNIDETN